MRQRITKNKTNRKFMSKSSETLAYRVREHNNKGRIRIIKKYNKTKIDSEINIVQMAQGDQKGW